MKLHPSLIALTALLALAACRPGVAEYSESEANNQLMLDKANRQFDVRFGRGSARLLPAGAARLRAAIADGTLIPSDRVNVATGGSPALAAARFASISSELLRYGIVATKSPLAAGAADRAIIQSGRYLVTLPACPNWSKQPSVDYTNTLSSNYGCADAINLGLMIASPADLAEARPVGMAAGTPAAAAIQRYEGDKVILPASANLSPIGANSTSPTGSGATGAGTAGTGP
jgi:pilus assembly protein CpaD